MGSALPEPLLRPEAPADAAALETLRRTLRALWGIDAAVFADGDVPHLSGRSIHLPCATPAGSDAVAWRLAAAAHAAAHLVYSPPALDGRGLKPLVRALVGVLEDARIETLAGRELPGLQRWWRAQHAVTPMDGEGVETLLLRLARALADPGYEDPHPWVRKGRALFFLDAGGTVLAEPCAERLREIASRLGHDLGQMRLQFNARSYRPGPDYRDDHRWMWPAEASDAAQEQPLPPPPGRTPPAAEPDDTAVRHPEWDRLIARLRPAWCRIAEQRAAAIDATGTLPPEAPGIWRRALLGARAGGRWQLRHDGPRIDLDALLRLRIARRGGLAGDERVHRGRSRERRTGSVLLLIDQSASTATPMGTAGRSQLQAAAQLAWLAARALSERRPRHLDRRLQLERPPRGALAAGAGFRRAARRRLPRPPGRAAQCRLDAPRRRAAPCGTTAGAAARRRAAAAGDQRRRGARHRRARPALPVGRCPPRRAARPAPGAAAGLPGGVAGRCRRGTAHLRRACGGSAGRAGRAAADPAATAGLTPLRGTQVRSGLPVTGRLTNNW
ncbi:MAG: hypothetical protein QM722_05890 [Piscinibacter sp.]